MPFDLEQSAERLAGNVAGFERRTLERIGRRIKATGQLSAYDAKALENIADIGIPLQEIYADLADVTAMNIKEVQTLLRENMTAETERNRPLYKSKGLPFIEYANNEIARQMVRYWVEETAGRMINLSKTKAIGFTKTLPNGMTEFTPLEGAFQAAIDKAVTAVYTGAADFNSVMRDTIEDLGGSGVVTNYGGGITRSLESAVRANILYGAKQSAQQYQEYIGDKFEADGFEVDYHPNPRPSHEAIGGEMFARGEFDKTIDGITYKSEYADLGYGKGAAELLKDYGCLHFTVPVILGISQPRYEAQWLKEQKKSDKEIIEYTAPDGNVIKGTRYDFKQKQRALEREVRKQKCVETAARACGDNALAERARDKINACRSAYDDLCKKTGLQPTKERMAVSGYDRKNVDNRSESGIIKSKNIETAVSNVHYVGKIDKNIYSCITDEIQTDEVIITDERIGHIRENHPNDYERYCSYLSEIINKPDYIVEANKPNTATVLKEITSNDEKFKLVLRLKVEKDPQEYKNSIISFWKIGDTTWKKTIKNKNILYKAE